MTWKIRKYPAISADTYLRETDFRAFSGDFGVSAPSPIFAKRWDTNLFSIPIHRDK